MKPRLATVSLTGCFGCHMSLLDIDERILELADLIDLDCSPFDDKKTFDRPVDVGFIEGGCANEHNVRVLRDFRRHCRILVSVGACAINGGLPALRNKLDVNDILTRVYRNPTTGESCVPDSPELPLPLDMVYPVNEIVRVDYFLPGCPPSGDAIWKFLTDLILGRMPRLDYSLLNYD